MLYPCGVLSTNQPAMRALTFLNTVNLLRLAIVFPCRTGALAATRKKVIYAGN